MEAQAESRALGLGLSEEHADAAPLALRALTLALTLPGGPLEGVRVGALRLASGEEVAPPRGGEAVAAPALGELRVEGDEAGEGLPAALAL